ncbi:TRAP transporter large permease [Puniceibacterium sediminis]|uniref:TRAP transporter, DctM subunit n=1 Tax=Puniceibacterium sediminis TaxID=1608407 RepID=A0A238ZG00_9RHOB|nr:TRAP transporter large permease [Puniceibacterium sediminis]SNR82267.1 TRAP transporter, DctM subunit [Puniceibacterium sediminis]
MTPFAVCLVGIAGLFALMILRTPVAFAMLCVGFFGYWTLEGFRSAGGVLLTESYSAVSNYNLIVVPMFVLLGNVSSVAGFSRGLYDAAFAWVGRFRGGLASASVLGCAAFATVSGSSVATPVTLGKVALPEMKRLGYSDSLATGSIAAGGTLGFLIPPSTGFVLYAILTQESIGRLFMAGILPDLLLMVLFMVAIWTVPLLGQAAPLLGVIVVSIGGIHLGVFTPVEASGVGAALVIFMAITKRRLTFALFRTAVLETLSTSAMLYTIVIGANVLNPFFAVTQIPATLGEGLSSLGFGAYGTLLVIILTYVVLGMFMDGLSMLVITVPVMFPVILQFGFDPIWFGVVAVIVIEMGMITPPVGLNVFVVRGIAGDVPLMTVFGGVTPFLITMIVGLALIVAFPQIALLIPNTMFGN